MNESEFDEEDAVTEQFYVDEAAWLLSTEISNLYAGYEVFQIVCLALGIPGNILSAIVWLRRHVAGKNSSAIYLAVLAINDLACLPAVESSPLALQMLYRLDLSMWFDLTSDHCRNS